MTPAPEGHRWSSVHASLGLSDDPLITPHPGYLALGVDAAQRACRYREWLLQGIHEDDVQAIRSHLQQERALGDPRFQAMVEKTLNRPVAVKPRGRPPKELVVALA